MSDDTNTPSQDELATLKQRADLMGLKYHPSIGVEALREKVAEKLREDTGQTPAQGAAQANTAPVQALTDTSGAAQGAAPAAAPKAPEKAKEAVPEAETETQKRIRLKKAAMKLVRIRITCMNPNKAEWEGEIFTVGNATVPTTTKYVPFNADEGWHVPHIIFEQIKARKCQVFTTKKDHMGRAKRTGKLINEFAIEVLDPLTREELAELAARQAATGAID